MGTTHDIDNDEALFQFDPFDSRQPLDSPSTPQPLSVGMTTGSGSPAMSPHHDAFAMEPTDEVGYEGRLADNADSKGKARTMPMPIPGSTIIYDHFEISSPSATSPLSYTTYGSSSSSMTFSPSTSNLSSGLNNAYRQGMPLTECLEQSLESETVFSESCTRKGKEKAPIPVLPPLSFSSIDFDYNQVVPPTPGPSSCGTLYSPTPMNYGLPLSSALSGRTDISIPSPSSLHSQEAASKAPVIRSRSLTSLPPSSFGSAHSPAAPSNISRQLLNILDNSFDLSTIDASSFISTLDLQAVPRDLGNCPPAWYIAASKPTDVASPRHSFRAKNRSRSSPYPVSFLDIIPAASTDIFQPLPIVVPNYFDLLLPKELQVHILRALVDLHEDDYQRSVAGGRLTMTKATSSRGRWLGRDKGLRELFKLSRVSKSWQALILDGQLWARLDLHSFPGIPQEVIIRLAQSAGSFVKSLNFAGHANLVPDTMAYITSDLCLNGTSLSASHNQLNTIDLQGCVSLTTRCLHQLLVRSKSLLKLNVKGLAVVTNTTCEVISTFCPNLTSLNMSRCSNMDADGINFLTRSANRRGEHLKLKELRLSGLQNVDDAMMSELARAVPFLEVLDLSYSRQLHNSAVEAFVACSEPLESLPALGVDTVLITPSDLGREANDSGSKVLRRRVTRLRHIILSYCVMLTDNACTNLSYSVPELEFLELAGLPDVKDTGLVKLLQQTPNIRRLDLEEALITDAVIRAITPIVDTQDEGTATPTNSQPKPKQPGRALQHLNIAYATSVSDDALLSLIRNCRQLTVLEVDNTRIGRNVLREFVRLSRERKALNARIVATDCRSITDGLVKELVPLTRPRLGFRRYDARKLNFLDVRDGNEDEMKVGQDECDEERVVVKSFYSWQTVDAVKALRDKRRKAAGRKVGSESSNGAGSDVEGGTGVGNGRKSGSTRWWSPGGRRAGNSRGSGRNSGSASPILPDLNGGDGCIMM